MDLVMWLRRQANDVKEALYGRQPMREVGKNEVKVATPRRHPAMPRRSYDHFNMIQHCLLTPRRRSATPRRATASLLPI
ncbi:hypothetical protein P8452_28946 [Trifolium repens]|nr:hypothetical protein P8452_28946 [Trifolium repens]